MALIPDQKFSTFQMGGDLELGDIVVGLRGGINTQFTWDVPASVTTVTGTANQVLVNGTSGSPVEGAVTLSAPQNIAPTSSPTFAALTLTAALTVANGGSGVQSFTPYALIAGGTSGTAPLQNIAGVGTTGQVLVSNGAGALPTWQSVPGLVASALTEVNDTNITLTLGGTPATALLQAVSITAGWTGTLSPARGGTGVNNGSNTITLGGTLTTSGAFNSTFTMTGATNVTFPTSGTLATTAGTVASVSGTTNQIGSTGGTTPVISIASNPIIPGTAGLTFPNGTTAQRAGGAGTMRFNSQTSVFEATVDGTNWATIETSITGVVSVSGTANRITSTGGTTPVIDISASYVGQSSITTLGTITTGVWTGTTIAVANGGTGVTSVTVAPTATSFAGWDANKNFSTNNLIQASNAVSRTNSSSYTLTVASAQQQVYSGTGITGDKVVMPNTTTMAINTYFFLINQGNTTLQVTASDGTTITTIPATYSVELFVQNTASSTNTSWQIIYFSPQAVTLTSSPTYAGMTLTNPYIAGAGGFHSRQIFTSGTAATYTKPSNVSTILIEVWGGGGGGGGALGGAGALAIGGAGGAGGYASLLVTSPSATYTYTVGAGGSAGTAGNNNGGAGGTTTFSASSLQATGGNGGSGSASFTGVGSILGAVGGVGTNGNINSGGAPGSGSVVVSGATAVGLGTIGGSSRYGAGGYITTVTTGAAGGIAAGGSGGISTTSSNAGGAGGAGLIIVWEFA
jgi:hypothetical protein